MRASACTGKPAQPAVTHPNIAAVYDVLDVDAYPYIVMEHVEGESLSTVLAAVR